MKRIFLSVAFSLLICPPVFATTYYVKSDGGSKTQCTGTTDAAYPGSGTGQPCRWRNFMYASGWNLGQATAISGGDTIIVEDSQKIGWDSTENYSGCAANVAPSCYPRALPSGPDIDHKTKVYGTNWASCTDQSCATELWGQEGLSLVLNLTSTSNVDVRSLLVTDHSNCAVDKTCIYTGNPGPWGPYAKKGIVWHDTVNAEFHNVFVRGLADKGWFMGNNKDYILDNCSAIGNHTSGFDSDRGDPNTFSDSGTNDVKVTVKYNGCEDEYPPNADDTPTDGSCCSQNQTCYGDGFTVAAGGAYNNDQLTYNVHDSEFSHNTSDGFDGLYRRGVTSTFNFTRIKAWGNAGNQLKLAGRGTLVDSWVVGDCAFFGGRAITQGGTPAFNNCRGFDAAVAWDIAVAGDFFYVYGSSLTGYTNAQIIEYSNDGPDICNGTELFRMKNTILRGNNANYSGGSTVDDVVFYGKNGSGTCTTIPTDIVGTNAGNIVYNTKTLLTGTGITNADPLFTDTIAIWNDSNQPVNYDLRVQVGSPSIGIWNNAYGNPTDFNNFTRVNTSGAFEYNSTAGCGIADGGACTANNQCCNSHCVLNVCVNSCTATLGQCSTNSNCCSGICCGNACSDISCGGGNPAGTGSGVYLRGTGPSDGIIMSGSWQF